MIFVEIVERGSITAAAESLDLPKSTVSERLKKLERQLGTRLLFRTTRSIQLSSAGEAFYENCSPARDAADAAVEKLMGEKTEPTGILRISMPYGFSGSVIPQLLQGFSNSFPNIRLIVTCSNSWLDIVSNQIDIAFRAGPLNDSELIARQLFTVKRSLVASPKYLSQHGSPKVPADLNNHRCLATPTTTEWHFTRRKKDYRITPNAAVTINDNDLLIQMAIEGAGIAVLNHVDNDYGTLDKRLEFVLPSYRLQERPIHLVYPERDMKRPNLSRFVDFVTSFDL